MISTVYFSTQATRDQLEGRINRLTQPKKEIDIIYVTSGILSHVLNKYGNSRNLSEALKGFADEINIDSIELRKVL